MSDTWTVVPGYRTVEYSDPMIFNFAKDTKAIDKITKQVLVSGEKNSQYIRFQAERYFDGIDLSGKRIQVVYLGSSGLSDINEVVNVECTDSNLRFGWVVPANACPEPGTLCFSIEFVSEDYVLKSKKYDAIVVEGLNGGNVLPEPEDSVWYIELQERCDEVLTKAETAATALDDIIAAKEAVENEIEAFGGTPLAANTAAGMTDTAKVYVYTGSETGYATGHWYYYDGAEWKDGGVYNAVAVVVDKTVSQPGMPPDAEETRKLINAISIEADDMEIEQDPETYEVDGTRCSLEDYNQAYSDFCSGHNWLYAGFELGFEPNDSLLDSLSSNPATFVIGEYGGRDGY